MLIDQSVAAAVKMVDLQKYHIGTTIKVQGAMTTTVITVELPLVADPAEDNDAHWQQATTEATAWQFDSDNLIRVVDGALGVVRFNKPAGDNVGLVHKW